MNKSLTRKQAIKQYCFECSGEDFQRVEKCWDARCPLWPYRRGDALESERSMVEDGSGFGKLPARGVKIGLDL